jgi:hypothetical protein
VNKYISFSQADTKCPKSPHQHLQRQDKVCKKEDNHTLCTILVPPQKVEITTCQPIFSIASDSKTEKKHQPQRITQVDQNCKIIFFLAMMEKKAESSLFTQSRTNKKNAGGRRPGKNHE